MAQIATNIRFMTCSTTEEFDTYIWAPCHTHRRYDAEDKGDRMTERMMSLFLTICASAFTSAFIVASIDMILGFLDVEQSEIILSIVFAISLVLISVVLWNRDDRI